MFQVNRFVHIVSIVVCLCIANESVIAASLQGLGDLPGGDFNSTAFGVSGDGLVVVGIAEIDPPTIFDGIQGFRWTAEDGLVGLGGDFTSSQAYDASADGSIVVGNGWKGEWGGPYEIFRWTEEAGTVSYDISPDGYWDSRVFSTSADGTISVGRTDGSWSQAIYWTEDEGIVLLGDLPGGRFDSAAFAISADGKVIVGDGHTDSGTEAFRWTLSDGMVGLGDLPGGSFASFAEGVSFDGSVIVGHSVSERGNEAFRWTVSSGMVGLGDLSEAFLSHAFAVSGDGSVVVGQGTTEAGKEAFVWTENEGMRSLQNILAYDFGIDMSGWQLTHAYDISYDGRTIVGGGINPKGKKEAWIAVIPEPAVVGFMALGLLGTLYCREITSNRLS